MEIKVKEVGIVEEKSVQQVEQELLDKHEEEFSTTEQENVQENVQEEVSTQNTELKEEDILSYIGNKYGKQINSLDEFTREREESEPLPEDVAAYFKYKKETGRNIEDFVKINRDLDDVNPDKLLRDYLMQTEKGLDAEDIDEMMEDYSYDAELV